MTDIIPLALFLVMFWVVVPLTSEGLKRCGWPDKARSAACLTLYFVGIVIAGLALHII